MTMSSLAYRSAKRGIDLLAASAGLVVLMPVLFATGLVVWATMGRPVLFRQPRPGRGGRIFRIVKFRTMRKPAPGEAPGLDAERLTKVGRFLRSTSLDELPELWNVVRGDMSLVGPRPLLPEYLPLYTPRQAKRHDVRPGLTGLAQVRGRNALSWEQRFDLDVEYVERQNLMLDFSILAATFGLVIRRRGISQEGHATMEPFRGNHR
jgi:lipopolysaccharide/colanic/teichoic acid biosynthesis glycosyltransferase